KEVLSQDSCVSPPTRPPNKLVGYYPAYKYNSLKPGRDFNISPSIDYLYFVAYGPNDLVNNSVAGGDPVTLFNSQYSKFNDLLAYRSSNPLLKFKLILSVLLPTDTINLVKFFNIPSNGGNPNLNPNSYASANQANIKFINDLISVVTANGFDG
ncbi:20906_t:CDS:2, partial [Dentiscutata erythropus]